MKKIFLLLAFTGIVSAASATSVISFNKGNIITLGGDDKKQDDKKKCDKNKSCCKSKQTAQAASGCSGHKTGQAKNHSHATTGTHAKSNMGAGEVNKEAKSEAASEPVVK